MRVWIVESGEYEQRHVSLVAESLDAAVAEIKRTYGQPYQVEWDDLQEEDGGEWWKLTGHFAWVPHYSIAHDATFEITPWGVATA